MGLRRPRKDSLQDILRDLGAPAPGGSTPNDAQQAFFGTTVDPLVNQSIEGRAVQPQKFGGVPVSPFQQRQTPIGSGTTTQISRVGKGSGLKDEAAEADKFRQTLTGVKAVPFTKKEFEEITGNVRELPEFQDAKSANVALENLLKFSAAAPVSPDLAGPLSALGNYLSGRGLTPTLQQKDTPEIRSHRMAELATQIKDGKSNLLNMLLGGVKAAQAGTATGQLVNEQLQNISRGAQDPSIGGGKGKGTQPKAIPVSERGRLVEVESAINNMAEFIDLVKKSRDKLGGTFGVKGFINEMKGRANIDKEIGLLFKKRQFLKQTFAKPIEGGVLRKNDEVKWDQIMSDLRTDPDIAIANLHAFLNDIRTRTSSRLSDLSQSFNTSSWVHLKEAARQPKLRTTLPDEPAAPAGKPRDPVQPEVKRGQEKLRQEKKELLEQRKKLLEQLDG